MLLKDNMAYLSFYPLASPSDSDMMISTVDNSTAGQLMVYHLLCACAFFLRFIYQG